MIQLTPKSISPKSQQTLGKLQRQIDLETTFTTKVSKAQMLWKSKGGQGNKDVFDEIIEQLTQNNVYL